MRSLALLLLFLFPLVFAQTGIITTIAGTVPGFGGDGGPATAAALTLASVQNECDPALYEEMNHISVDRAGNIYIADTNNNRIRRIAPDGVISTVAGSGQRPPIETAECSPLANAAEVGDGGQASAAKLYGPSQAIMLPNGVLLICDQKNNRIRQVTQSGIITTVVGTDRHTFFLPEPSPAALSSLDWANTMAADAEGLLYFAELHSNRIARVNSDGRLKLIAGTGLRGSGADGPDAKKSALSNPAHIAFDRLGNLLVVEQGNHRVRRIAPGGAIMTVAGTGAPGYNGDDRQATAAQLNRPNAVAVDAVGNLYIADMGNHRVRRVAVDGTISTIAGTGDAGQGADGIPATESRLNFPNSVAVDNNGDVLIVDWQNYLIRKVSFAVRPAISPGGVVNAGSFLPVPLAPGALISIFGTNFATALTQASELPLPTEMAGASAAVNGTKIPLVFVSSNQINAQLPYDVREGEAKILVATAEGVSTEETVNIGAAAPGIFMIAGGTRAVAINQDFTLNTAENAETRGRVMTVYLTGIGPLDGELEAGQPAPATTLYRAALESSATIGGQDTPVLFLGLTPGFVGLAQANLQIPADGPVGAALELVISVNRQRSNTVLVAVK
jgi:uncharacterized protein (TIGR03437 family)